MKRIALILVGVLLLAPMAAQAGKRNGRSNSGGDSCSLTGLLNDFPAENLRKKERDDLLYMREEEKLARDTYLSLHEQWGLRVFRQIAKAETNHMAAIGVMIDKYELVDPVGDNPLGVFTNPELQSLYEDLSVAGSASLIGALQVGAAIEDVDIYDLQRALERTNNKDLQIVYQNLMKGSRNHLRAFVKLLDRYGETYEPVYLSPDEYQEIIDSPREKGVVDADGDLLCGGGKR